MGLGKKLWKNKQASKIAKHISPTFHLYTAQKPVIGTETSQKMIQDDSFGCPKPQSKMYELKILFFCHCQAEIMPEIASEINPGKQARFQF